MSQQKLKRVGIAIPAKDPSLNIGEGTSLMPDDVRLALLKSLEGKVEIVLCNIDKAYAKNGKVYEGDVCLSDLDMVFWCYVTHGPDSWNVLMLQALAQTTKVVPDPAGVMRGLDKFHAHTILRNAGVPTADFALFEAGAVNDMADQLCGDGQVLLLKPRLGAFGHGIHMAKSKRDLVDAVQYAQSFVRAPLQVFCETFEENDLSKWISATIIDGELIYGYRKKPEKFVGDWKVYDADRKGGGVDYVDPSPVRDVALAAAKAMGCHLIGFDFIYSTKRQEYVIVDENTFPGLYPDCFTEAGKGTWDENFLRMILNNLG